MKRILISMALLLSMVAVQAQTQTKTDEFTKEINKAIEVMNISGNFTQTLTDQMQPLVEQGMITAENVVPLVKEMGEWIMPKVKERVAALYKENFTLEEVKQINAFYSTPVGRKMQNLVAKFSAEGTKVAQTPEAQQKMQEIFIRYMKK